ncbi:hypothetical protein GCM10011415_22200 [Salipiger pallidus]|uniref:Uncharacterized protein n=1 Tax=Salipiger pallidus TaxID=1775170 RepID=A0A8J2ZKH6_9RHOB|nr:hypothetical protein GCM10011415_22200 [Salipiger pallidus]
MGELGRLGVPPHRPGFLELLTGLILMSLAGMGLDRAHHLRVPPEGQTALTRMPFPATSSATLLFIPISACFKATQALLPGPPVGVRWMRK